METNKKIRLATGWHKGLEGKWKYETSDNDVDFKHEVINKFTDFYNGKSEEVNSKLGDLLKNQELFKLYPSIKDTNIRIVNYPSLKARAS